MTIVRHFCSNCQLCSLFTVMIMLHIYVPIDNNDHVQYCLCQPPDGCLDHCYMFFNVTFSIFLQSDTGFEFYWSNNVGMGYPPMSHVTLVARIIPLSPEIMFSVLVNLQV